MAATVRSRSGSAFSAIVAERVCGAQFATRSGEIDVSRARSFAGDDAEDPVGD